jgi:hypothetical protein
MQMQREVSGDPPRSPSSYRDDRIWTGLRSVHSPRREQAVEPGASSVAQRPAVRQFPVDRRGVSWRSRLPKSSAAAHTRGVSRLHAPTSPLPRHAQTISPAERDSSAAQLCDHEQQQQPASTFVADGTHQRVQGDVDIGGCRVSPRVFSPSIATLHDEPWLTYRVLQQKRQKLKKWHDGKPHLPRSMPAIGTSSLRTAGTLRFHTFNNRMLLYDEARSLIVCAASFTLSRAVADSS